MTARSLLSFRVPWTVRGPSTAKEPDMKRITFAYLATLIIIGSLSLIAVAALSIARLMY